jgi:pimeloyl-ACP methyl ester carboxylesterase
VDRLRRVPQAKRFHSSDGLSLAYYEWGVPGASAPVALHHGFVANAHANWEGPGVVAALVAAGRHVIAPDARGHGRSDKPHDPASYGEARMANDLGALLDAVGATEVDLVGYSMGAVVSLLFAAGEDRVRRLVIGGVGSGVVECGGVDRRALSNDSIVEALEAPDPEQLQASGAIAFRQLADALGSDRRALVAQARSIHRAGVELSRISAPTLLLAGETDPLQLLHGDHMQALADPRFTASIVDFLT